MMAPNSIRAPLLVAVLMAVAVAATSRTVSPLRDIDVCVLYNDTQCVEHVDKCADAPKQTCSACSWHPLCAGCVWSANQGACPAAPVCARRCVPCHAWGKVDFCFETKIAAKLPAKFFKCDFPTPPPAQPNVDCQSYLDEVWYPMAAHLDPCLMA